MINVYRILLKLKINNSLEISDMVFILYNYYKAFA